jgi:antitoxin component YwqK of YwqJK toxin-antitoxin module
MVSRVVNGNGMATIFDENGVLLKKIKYKNGKPIYE